MKPSASGQPAKPALELIEEAVYLLRAVPVTAFAAYYAGSLPFLLGFLAFWSEMSRSPLALQRLPAASLGMAVLYVWMKFWQAIFVRGLRAQLSGTQPARLSLGGTLRLLFLQGTLQPLGLFLQSLALVLLVPFPFVCAFFQSVSVLAHEDSEPFGSFLRRASRQALLWRRQSFVLLPLLGGFGFLVLLNWTTFCLMLPALLKMLLGLQTDFSRSGFAMLNTTFLAAMLALTYLTLDPLLKAVFLLRCFYGESLRSGDDLVVQLRFQGQSLARVAALAALLFILCTPACSRAGAESANRDPAPQTAVEPAQLDHTIQQVMQETKYTWRMPRQKPATASEQSGFFSNISRAMSKWLTEIMDWLKQKLKKLFRDERTLSPGGSFGWASTHLLLVAVASVVVVFIIVMLFRAARERRAQAAALAIVPVQAAPDLSQEHVGADQLPEDGWTRLAKELLGRGELRLALRAFYFASLAHLAGRNLISLALFKSNHDYQRELNRRGHAFPELVAVFQENVSVFERIWYGLHELQPPVLERFVQNVDRLRSIA